MDDLMGFGGLGDCFICALKCMEYEKPYLYTHVDTSISRLKMSEELLNILNINNRCLKVDNIKEWWYNNASRYTKCFNVFAKGYIDIPIRPYHWQPCIDEGYSKPYCFEKPKKNRAIIQVSTGGNRTYKNKPIVEYAIKTFDLDTIVWVGTDKEFNSKIGTNLVGKTTLKECLNLISNSSHFVGFNSLLLYWSLYNKLDCFLFTDHQGREDLRIHDEWKNHLNMDI